MRKGKHHVSLAVIMAFCMAMIFSTVAIAGSKNVTKKYKEKARTVIGQFDGYLGYGCDYSYTDNDGVKKKSSFVFDDYARSTMLCLNDWKGFYEKTLTQMKPYFEERWKNAFTAPYNFRMIEAEGMNGYYTLPIHQWSNVSYLIQINKQTGRAKYYGGNWGEVIPRGYVRKIIKKNKSTFVVSYDIYWWDSYNKVKDGLMGSYRITLKRSGNAFKIDDIKRTKALAEV